MTYYRVGTTEFKAYTNDVYFDSGWELWPPLGSTGYFFATPHLPSGALITYLELDYCDTNTAQHLNLSFFECNPLLDENNCSPLGQIISVGQPANAPCATANVAINHTVDNLDEVLSLALEFGAFDYTNVLHGVVIGYKLQVSSPPTTPTFNDVPTTDPDYQFIEALAASGITSGCGGGNYCPDNPVTRRQIAIMMAKALGLSFN